ncbi:MAG: hypothetical protein CM1200mP1_06700 [Candidatus Neomarinimicrobiota bacterium]|nr:MAG: hypothetical protein CM1200mP1_06700 [Candidatus Neomarinimicrobiota bacterium]
MYGSIIGQIEVFPKKFFVSIGMDWMNQEEINFFQKMIHGINGWWSDKIMILKINFIPIS